MAKPKKKKSGLHKRVSSVLKGVPIPQGVRNWRPPGKGVKKSQDDSSDVPQAEVSSVFKGVSKSGIDGPGPTPDKSLGGRRTEPSAEDMAMDRQTSRLDAAEPRQTPGKHPTDVGESVEKTSEDRVVRYHDPAEEVSRLSLRQRIWEKLFGAKD